MVNISRGGALVVAGTDNPEALPISLRIDTPVRTDWVDATIVRVDASLQIGVRFHQGCPDDLLMAGTVGIDLAFLLRGGPNLSTACD